MGKRYSDKILFGFFYFFLLFTMFFPVGFTLWKLLFLAILCVGCVAMKKIKIPEYYKYVLIFVVVNLFSMVIGALNDTPGYLRTVTVSIIYPLILPIIFYQYCTTYSIRTICQVIVFAGVMVSIYDILYVLTELEIIGFFRLCYIENLKLGFSNYGYIHFTSSHLNTLFFTFPFTVSLLFFFSDRDNQIVSKKWLLCAVLIQLLCILLSTRLALILLAVASPFLVYTIKFYFDKRIHFSKKELYLILLVLVAICFGMVLFFDYFEVLINFVINKLKHEATSESIRSIQKEALLQGWLESPIWGHGTGAYTESVIRDVNMPWAYEKTYYALLFQQGLLGFVTTFGFYFVIISSCFKLAFFYTSYKAIGISYAVGLIIFLIANANDPYLGKFGYMWVLFLPFCVGNIGVVFNRRGRS